MLTSKQIRELEALRDKNVDILAWDNFGALVKIYTDTTYKIQYVNFESAPAVSVSDFGAVRDGVTDNTQAFRLAIESISGVAIS